VHSPAHEAGPGLLAAQIASKSLQKAFQGKVHPKPYPQPYKASLEALYRFCAAFGIPPPCKAALDCPEQEAQDARANLSNA